jgi:UrcA family protein
MAKSATMLAPAKPAPHIKITAQDLDLTMAKRRQTLTLRIAHAASQLCDGAGVSPSHGAAGLAIDSLRKIGAPSA